MTALIIIVALAVAACALSLVAGVLFADQIKAALRREHGEHAAPASAPPVASLPPAEREPVYEAAGRRYAGLLADKPIDYDRPPVTPPDGMAAAPGDERSCGVPGAHGRTAPYYCTLPAHHYPRPGRHEHTAPRVDVTRPADRIPTQGRPPWSTQAFPVIDPGAEEQREAEERRVAWISERLRDCGQPTEQDMRRVLDGLRAMRPEMIP